MSMPVFSVTRHGKPLSKDLYKWDEETRTFSAFSRFVDDLVLDFEGIDNCTFNTGKRCVFKTGSNCTFNTISYCTFDTGSNCTFDTGSYCTFDTGSDCTFKTSSNCTFNTGSYCTFKTSSYCTFDTGSDCTFNTGSYCTFKTSSYCTFKTDTDCVFDTGWYNTFDTGSNCTFNSGSDCTFKTSSYCTFKTETDCVFDTGWYNTFDTGSNCTFNSGSDCTFNTGSYCTFKTGDRCVLVRRDTFEIHDISNRQIQTCPCDIKGYIENGYYYVNGEKQYKAIIADGILSEIINHRGNVYKVKNYGEDKISYIVQDGDIYSHGATIKEAKDSLIYKISNRDTSMYNSVKLDDEFDLKDIIRMYRVIAGACESGTRYFVETHKLPNRLTVRQAIDLTKGQYNSDIFRKFFEDKETNKV